MHFRAAHVASRLPKQPQGVALFDSDRKLLFWDESFASLVTPKDAIRHGLTIQECMALLPATPMGPSTDTSINVASHPDGSPSKVIKHILPGGDELYISVVSMETGSLVMFTTTVSHDGGPKDAERAINDEPLRDISADDHEMLLNVLMARRDIGCLLYDADDNYLAWNDAYLELWPDEARNMRKGYSYREALRKWLETELSPEEQPNIERHLAAGLVRHRGNRDGYTYQRSDGRWIFAQPHFFKDGRMLKTWSDVTPLISRETNIERVTEMVVDAGIGFIQFDAKGRFIVANKKLHELFPEAQMRFGRNVSYAEHLEAYAKNTLAESEYTRIAALIARTDLHSNLVREPIVFRCRDGRWLQFKERSHPDGGIISMWMDISPQVRATAELANLRSQLFAAIRNMSEGFALFGPDDSLVVCNDQYRSLMGARCPFGVGYESVLEAALLGRHFDLADQDRLSWKAELVTRHREAQAAVELRLTDGRWLRIASRATDDGGRISIAIDVTERKQTEINIRAAQEAAEAASRAKSEFLANMSHELRTPLNAIIGFADVLSYQRLGPISTTPTYLDYGQSILQSGHHLLGIINTILDLAKIEAGHFELMEETIAVGDLIQACHQIIQGRTMEAQVLLELEIEPDLPLLVADARSMKQSILNLLSNAVKFSNPGGRVSIAAGLTPQGSLAISVRDTGIGIAEEDIEKVVLPFGQVEHSLNRRHEGIGLGLPLTKKMIERHGGQLHIASRLGVGTTATLILQPERLRKRA